MSIHVPPPNPNILLPGAFARTGKIYPAVPADLDRWRAQNSDARLIRDGLTPNSERGAKFGYGADAFTNAAARTGFGTQSVAEGADYELVRWSYNYWLMITLYRNQWIPRKIVDIPAQDMVRAWPKLTSDLKPEDLSKIDRSIRETQTKKQMLEALRWSRLFGGAGALIVIDGHENRLEEPLDLDTVELGSYQGLIPFDRWVGIYPDEGVCSDITRPREFNLPEFYRVQVPGGGAGFRIHASRILRFTGPSVPAPEYQAQMYWGISCLEIVYEAMKMRDNMLWNMLGLSFRANLLSFKFDTLAQMLSGASSGQQAMVGFYQRMEALNSLISNQNMLITPKDGGLDSTQYNFGGCSDLLEQFRFEVAGAASIPETRLFGRSPTGLGVKDDPAERLYEEMIAAGQEDKLRPEMDKLYPIVCMSVLGKVPDDLDLKFPSIRVMDEKDKSDLATATSTSVIQVFGAGLAKKALCLKELKQSSQVTGMWTNIQDEDIEEAEKEDKLDAKMLSLGLPGMGGPGESEVTPGAKPKGAESGGEEGDPEEAEIAEALAALESEGEEEPAKAKSATDGYSKDLLKYTFAGLPIAVEYPKGTRRTIRNPKGRVVYDRVMQHDYGFVLATTSRFDGDEIDVIVGPDPKAPFVYICFMIDLGPDVAARSNENKICLGFADQASAEQAFIAMYPPSFLGEVTEVPIEEFVKRMRTLAKDGKAA